MVKGHKNRVYEKKCYTTLYLIICCLIEHLFVLTLFRQIKAIKIHTIIYMYHRYQIKLLILRG